MREILILKILCPENGNGNRYVSKTAGDSTNGRPSNGALVESRAFPAVLMAVMGCKGRPMILAP